MQCEPWAAMILRDIEARRRKAMEVCFKYFCCAPTVLYLRMDKPPLLRMKFFRTLAPVCIICLFHTFLNFHSQVMASRREAEQSKTKEAVEEVHKKLFLEKILLL